MIYSYDCDIIIHTLGDIMKTINELIQNELLVREPIDDICKKILYHGKEYDAVEVMLEIGDILYYLTAICNILGFDLSEIMLNNNAKLMARYKDGYSIEQSLNRIEDKQKNGDNR